MTADLSTQSARLRAFALRVARGERLWTEDDAIGALAEDADPAAWRSWRETQATSGQWFLWRDPAKPGDIHADQVEVGEDGRIEMKYGCGLNFYPECQPCRFAEDVRKIIKGREAEAA